MSKQTKVVKISLQRDEERAANMHSLQESNVFEISYILVTEKNSISLLSAKYLYTTGTYQDPITGEFRSTRNQLWVPFFFPRIGIVEAIKLNPRMIYDDKKNTTQDKAPVEIPCEMVERFLPEIFSELKTEVKKLSISNAIKAKELTWSINKSKALLITKDTREKIEREETRFKPLEFSVIKLLCVIRDKSEVKLNEPFDIRDYLSYTDSKGRRIFKGGDHALGSESIENSARNVLLRLSKKLQEKKLISPFKFAGWSVTILF